MHGDTLSNVLRAVHLSGSLFFRVRLRPPYGVTALGVQEMIEEHAPGVQHILPFHLVTQGSIWVDVDGTDPVFLDQGDLIVLPRGAVHRLVDRPGTPAVPVGELRHAFVGNPATLEWGGAPHAGEASEALCGFFHCNGRLFNPLLDALPEVLVIRAGADGSDWLSTALRRAYDEVQEPRQGGAALVSRLTELLFLEVVQRHLQDGEPSGWFAALKDPIAGAVLTAIHDRPEYPWTLERLAQEVGASRSVVAERFTATVGLSPIRYLAAWRMELAAERLEETSDPIAEIAVASGYQTEAAFNRAFKRHTGQPPAAWRRRRTLAAALPA